MINAGKNRSTQATSFYFRHHPDLAIFILSYQGKVGCPLPPVICSWATSEEQLGVKHHPHGSSIHISHQIPPTGSWFKPSTFHLHDNSLILKFLPGFEPHQREHLYCKSDITAPSLLNGQTSRGRGWPTAWTLSHCEHYRWHFNEPRSKFPNIISMLDGLYWSACYSKCLPASPCRAFSFYVKEQKGWPWKDVGRVS